MEFWVVWWIPGEILVGFVALMCFWWNSGWSGGFLVGSGRILGGLVIFG